MAATDDRFGSLIKRRRLAAGLTQTELAERAGISARAVSNAERGESSRPNRRTLELLIDALDVDNEERARLLAALPPRIHGPRKPARPSPRALPEPPSAIVGRREETAAVVARLKKRDTRLLTILGPVGVGKTRLALAVAHLVKDAYAHGVWFIELAEIDDAEKLPRAIAAALDLRLPAAKPPLEALAAAIRDRRLLLVLDNLEQMDAGPVLADLLAMAPRLKILATSRRALRIRWEHEYALAPLAVPDPAALPGLDDLAAIPAVSLFLQRVRAGLPDFRLTPANAAAIAAICARLDGLPLAIELAASRARIVAPEEMATRLQSSLEVLGSGSRDMPERHRSLAAAIRWSHDLLSPAGRIVFRRFAATAGGASLAALEAICLDGERDAAIAPGQRLSGAALLSGLDDLLDASMIRRETAEDGETRFSMLQTIHACARDQLVDSGEARAIELRHGAWATRFAETAETFLFTVDEPVWLGRLRRDHDNIDAALNRAIARGDGDLAMRLAGAMFDYWYLRGEIAAGADCLRQVLSTFRGRGPVAVKALVGASLLTMAQGDIAAAAAYGDEAFQLATALGDRASLGKALTARANVAQHRRDYATSFDLHRRAFEIFDDLGDASWTATELCNLAWTAHGKGDDEAAAGYAERLRHLATSTRDTYLAGVATLIFGDLALAAGRTSRAAALYREVLGASRRRGDRWLAADALVGFAASMAAHGDHHGAARILGAAERLYRDLGVAFPPRDRPDFPSWIEAIRERLGEERFAETRAAGGRLSPRAAAAEATSVIAAAAD